MRSSFFSGRATTAGGGAWRIVRSSGHNDTQLEERGQTLCRLANLQTLKPLKPESQQLGCGATSRGLHRAAPRGRAARARGRGVGESPPRAERAGAAPGVTLEAAAAEAGRGVEPTRSSVHGSGAGQVIRFKMAAPARARSVCLAGARVAPSVFSASSTAQYCTAVCWTGRGTGGYLRVPAAATRAVPLQTSCTATVPLPKRLVRLACRPKLSAARTREKTGHPLRNCGMCV